jgi:O-succinylbenzoic acid--CoA ligase
VKLKFGQNWSDLSELDSINPTTLSEQEMAALDFCKRWKNGAQEFEFETSGSTGSPRKVRFTRKQLQASADLTRKALNLTEGTTALVCVDVRFIAGVMMLVRGMMAGMNLVIQTPSADPFSSLSDTIDFVALVPYQLAAALAQSPSKVAALKTVIIGGAPLPEDLWLKIKELPGRYYATYGMTETISHIALQKLNGADAQDFFELLPGISAEVDQRGCLLIRAPHLDQSPVVTNDVVDMVSATRFKWVGRVDQVINSAGVKVHPSAVEAASTKALHNLQLDRRLFVAGLADAALGTRVVIVVEGAPFSRRQENKFLVELSTQLSKYELPKQVLYLDRFVETRTQKVDRLKTLDAIRSRG